MSTVTSRIPLADAIREAEAFKALFTTPTLCYERWEIAGSVRRKRPDIADIEHVVQPYGNLVWNRMAGLLRDDTSLFSDPRCPLTKHVYPNGTHRWGDKYRGVDFNGRLHEVFVATPENWGNQLCIRTGPAAFSQMMVTRLHDTELRQRDGFLRRDNGAIVPCDTEEQFFAFCGRKFIAPELRE